MTTKPKTTSAAATAGVLHTDAAAVASAAAEESALTFRVLSPIRFDGKLYAPGASIALTAADYQQLRTSGAIDPEPVAEAQDAGQR